MSLVNQVIGFFTRNDTLLNQAAARSKALAEIAFLQRQDQYGAAFDRAYLDEIAALTGTAPNVSPVSPLTFMLTPQNALSAVTNNNTQNQAIQQGANNAAAAASNYNSANLFDSLTSQIGPLSSAAGALINSGNNAGVGAQTSYASFLANNPQSTAAIGQNT